MLDRLMKDRGIEAGDYKSLARELAIKHEPKFKAAHWRLEHGDYGRVIRDKGRGGRPTKWTQEELDKLVNDVADAKEKYCLATDEEALRYITKQGKWDQDDRTKLRKTLKNKLAAERRARHDADLLCERDEKIRRRLFERTEKIRRRDNPEN